MTSTSVVLELRDLRRTFRQAEREIKVLNNASATLAAGQAVALVGPSGAGLSCTSPVCWRHPIPDT
jgi:ABC-type glutathione transport system ATPase component